MWYYHLTEQRLKHDCKTGKLHSCTILKYLFRCYDPPNCNLVTLQAQVWKTNPFNTLTKQSKTLSFSNLDRLTILTVIFLLN